MKLGYYDMIFFRNYKIKKIGIWNFIVNENIFNKLNKIFLENK